MSDEHNERLNKLERKVEDIDRKTDIIDSKIDSVLTSLKGDGINDGFIADVRRSVKKNSDRISSLEGRSFTKTEKDDIMNFITLMKGWKGVFVVIIWLLPTLLLVYNFYKAQL